MQLKTQKHDLCELVVVVIFRTTQQQPEGKPYFQQHALFYNKKILFGNYVFATLGTPADTCV